MNELQVVFQSIVFIAGTLVFTACSQGQKAGQSEEGEPMEMMEAEGHEEEGMTHEHGESHTMDTETEANQTWAPSGKGIDLIRSDFHFVAGGIENIKPQVKNVDGTTVLELTTDGKPTAFVFHNTYGNVGVIATLRKLDFEGTIKVIHHAKDLAHYEFVSIKDNQMKLGRVVNGTEKIFDTSQFEAGQDWIPLKVTAAGTHFKGYVGDKTITHGHGDKMAEGYVGLLLEGNGTVQIRSIETATLEDE